MFLKKNLNINWFSEVNVFLILHIFLMILLASEIHINMEGNALKGKIM